MTATPRIVFSTFRSSSDPMFLAWARFLATLETAACRDLALPSGRGLHTPPARLVAAPPVTGPCGIWRILAPNNRELGRSALAYTSFESARAHVLRLRDTFDELAVGAITGGRPGMHGWVMSLKATLVLTCGRWYGASASSSEAALATIDALREGFVSESSKELLAPRRGEKVTESDLVW